MTKMILFIALGLLIALSAGGAFAALDPALAHARDAQDRPALEKLMASARASADRSPKDASLQYQYALAAAISAEVALEQRDKAAAERDGLAGVKAIDAAIAINPNNAEYYRVLATLCGEVIPANIFSALSYGKRAKEAIEKAKQIDPKSPQVWIADGVGNFYLPASFGGGPDPAIRSFQHAIQLDPKSAEAWLWLGRAQRKKQDDAEARKSFEKALALDPSRAWAKEQLQKIPAAPH
jgi:tetratricopeptide (TPR) repeat protein